MSLEIRFLISPLTGVPGLLLSYGGYRLPGVNTHSVLCDRIAGGCFGGIGVMSATLILNATVNELSNIAPNALVLTALGSGAGFETGLSHTKARTRSREAEQRSRELASHKLENSPRLLAHERIEAMIDADPPMTITTHDIRNGIRGGVGFTREATAPSTTEERSALCAERDVRDGDAPPESNAAMRRRVRVAVWLAVDSASPAEGGFSKPDPETIASATGGAPVSDDEPDPLFCPVNGAGEAIPLPSSSDSPALYM